MNEVYFVERSPDYLEHHGILGQKWGIRRFQNPDGSLTEEGRKRYGDILTPDQMKNMIKSYNLRTGKNKKINKNTTFKTSHGTYDYKGRRIDTDTNIEDPGNKEKPEYNTKKKPSEMTDEELEYATARQKAERLYKEEYAKNNPTPPEKISNAKQFMNNLRDDMIDSIPRSIAAGLGNYINRSITNLANDSSGGQQNQQQNQNRPQQPKPQTQPQQNQNKQPKPQAQPQPQPQKPQEQQQPKEETIKDKVDKVAQTVEKVSEKAGRTIDTAESTVKNTVADAKTAYEKGRNANYNNRVNLLDSAIKDLGFSKESGAAQMARSQLERVARNASGKQYDTKEYYKTNANNIIRGYYEARAAQLTSDWGLKTLDQIPKAASPSASREVSSHSSTPVSSISNDEYINLFVDMVRKEVNK